MQSGQNVWIEQKKMTKIEHVIFMACDVLLCLMKDGYCFQKYHGLYNFFFIY
uniref:Uncharacterized protein n=1 Tax=Lepeophtheirus salmonis TaxID=72036 RepID=A0A0K2UUE0_LEPSM